MMAILPGERTRAARSGIFELWGAMVSEKYLTESDWKKFSKGKNYKDAGLLKAFAALEKAEKSSADEQLEALDEIDKQGQILLKAHKGDEELADYIDDDMDRALAKQRKAAEQAAKAESEKDGDEEEETPALLTKKMIPVIRQVRKGETVRVMIATAGKDTVLLMSRKAIPGTRKKLLMTELGVTGGVKFINGDCLFEENAYTFVVQAGAGGLAKKLKAALLKQVELRLKVRVRGEDPADVDDDGEEAEDEGGEGESSEGEGEQQPTPPSPEQRDYEARWTALEPGYLAALKNPQADASKLRALHGFAQGKSAIGDYKAALQALDGLAKVINAATGAPPLPTGQKPSATAPSTAPADPALARFNARLAALLPGIKEAGAAGQDAKLKANEAGVLARKKDFDQAGALLDEAEALLKRLGGTSTPGVQAQRGVPDLAAQRAAAKSCLEIWRDAKESADVGLSRLQGALKASDEPALLRIADYGLHGVSKGLQVGLRVALEEFARQSDPAGGAGQKLRASVADFRRFLDTDPAIQLCDDNPFGVAVSLRPTLGAALKQIDQQLDALAG